MPNSIVEQELTIPDVQVTIGTIDSLAPSPIYEPSELIGGIFTDYAVENRWEADGQIFMMPVTSPEGFDGDQVSFVKLAAGTMLWIVDWTAEKAGEAPSIPNPDLEDANIVLMDKHFYPAQLLKAGADGSVLYRMSGTYVYGFKNPLQATLYYGRPPWMSKDVDCSVSQSQFVDGIITCNTSPQSDGSENQPTNPDQA